MRTVPAAVRKAQPPAQTTADDAERPRSASAAIRRTSGTQRTVLPRKSLLLFSGAAADSSPAAEFRRLLPEPDATDRLHEFHASRNGSDRSESLATPLADRRDLRPLDESAREILLTKPHSFPRTASPHAVRCCESRLPQVPERQTPQPSRPAADRRPRTAFPAANRSACSIARTAAHSAQK